MWKQKLFYSPDGAIAGGGDGVAAAAAGVPASTVQPAESAPAPASSSTTGVAQAVEANAPAETKVETGNLRDVQLDAETVVDGRSFVLEKDPVTGKPTLKPHSNEQASEGSAAADTDSEGGSTATEDEPGLTGDVPDSQAQESAPYTIDELSDALAMGVVDETRVPVEFRAQYANYKIAQALQRQSEAAAAQANKAKELEDKLSQPPDAESMKAFYKSLDDIAKQRALKDFGLDNVSYEDYIMSEDYSDQQEESIKTAVEWHKAQLINEFHQKAAQEANASRAQREIYAGINEFVAEAKSKEPNFNQIDVLMQSRYKSLPYNDAKPIEEAILALQAGKVTVEQTAVLKQYYDATRREFYAKKNNLTTTPKPVPPTIEKPGNGQPAPNKDTTPDYGELRNAGFRGKREWLAQHFFGGR